MKILFFIDGLSAGGKERRLTELMKALAIRPGIDFELVVMSKEIYYKEVLDLPINIHFLIRKTKKDFSVIKKFYEICKNYRPDVVHCWDSMTACYSVLPCKLLHIKLVNGLVTNATLKTNLFNKHWLRAKLTFPFSDLIVGNSEAGLVAYKVPRNKSLVIYNGFNFDRTISLIEADLTQCKLGINTKYVIGMVASYSEKKDYRTFFNAARIILSQRQDVTFLAIGSNTDSLSSQNLLENKYQEHFKLLGNRTDIESIVNCMDIGVLATFTEGISNSILEYMALGKPVIATSGGGTDEIVQDNTTGFLVSKSNSIELAEKMELLLENVELRKSMGLSGQKRIESEFSIKLMVDKYISIYKQPKK